MDEKIKKVLSKAKELGIEHLILIIKNDPTFIFKYEDISIKDAMSMMIAGFRHVITMEIERHPEYKKEFVAIFKDLDSGFVKLVKNNNQKFLDYKKSQKISDSIINNKKSNK